VVHWPAEGAGLTALTDEAELPLPDVSVDRVLLAHSLECAEQIRPLLREMWRVLTDGGRLIAIVPNRRGLWAQTDRTPFGTGHPYTTQQIARLFRDNMFDPIRTASVLYAPPSRSRMLIASAPAWEKLGARLFPGVSGVVMLEASKRIYAVSPAREAARSRSGYARLPPAAPAPSGG
jgi:SAM-dependent methyltransferase